MHEKRIELEELTGIKWNIDHIVPLKNDLVCGLHCIDNFQLLTKDENLSKSNKFNPEEYSNNTNNQNKEN